MSVRVESALGPYDVHIEPGALSRLPGLVAGASRVAVIHPAALARLEGLERECGSFFDWLEADRFANDKAIVLFGTVGNFFVMTLAPTKSDDARLGAQIGLTGEIVECGGQIAQHRFGQGIGLVGAVDHDLANWP